MKKRWNIIPINEEKVFALQKDLKINPALCSLLINRGVDTYENAKHYFRPDISQLHDPYLMKDMEKAVVRILTAIEKNEKILIFGDYDVDGTTAVAVVYRFIQKIADPEKLDFYIPHRYREGYGVSKQGIDHAKENGFTLVITLDCGIKSNELVEYANELGLDFIICDHHLPGNELPPALAILNAKQPDCLYPYKELCGCGVGFKLISALAQRLHLPDESYLCFLDLVVTAIGADIVPITGENRILAWYGLKKLNANPGPGIKALIELSNQKSAFTINNVVFVIAPKVNAAGRMDDASKAVHLFIEDDYEKAKELAEMLHTDNSERKDADMTITEEALSIIMNDVLLQNKTTTVLYQPHWHKGVVGIVASRLIEKYHRPTVILTMGESVVGGSARSVKGYNLYEAIHACREHLLGYGGHFAAAGMTMLPENVDAFSHKFEAVVSSTIDPMLLIPEIQIDSVLEFKHINIGFYNIIKQMEPFGPENMRPVFVTRNVTDTGWSKIVKEKHLRIVVKKEGITMTGIGFNMADKYEHLQNNNPVDIVYTLDENEWENNVSIQLKILDIKPSEMADQC